MKLFVISVALLLAGTSLADEIPPGGECTPGSRWKKECNWCSCTNDGMGAFCTLKGCPQEYQADPSEEQCEAGSQWKVDCNTCVCVDGQPRCTQKGCLQVEQNVRDDADIPPGATCKPGSRWMQECNWCSCGENGVMASCTLMACVPGYQPSPDMKQCEIGSKWRDHCNLCTCVDERIRCTKRACIDRPVPQNPGLPVVDRSRNDGETCTEGSRWREDCNWCTCTNGVGICTLRACIGDTFQTDVPECEGNARWKKDCNWCNCVNGRGICTTRACFVRPQTPSTSVEVTVARDDIECTEHSRWRKECNWCRCANGRGVCTKQACIPETDKSGEPECAGDSRWKKDCNWCYCLNGRGICTSRACNIRPQLHSGSVQVTVTREEAQCTEGSRWRQDCNWCRCVEGRGACTKRGCIPGRVVEGPECEGNSSWKKDCNTCNCVDGKAVCTLRACVGEVPHQRSGQETCEEGESWAQDCNRCVCRNGVPTCTKRLCRGPSVDITRQTSDQEPCEEGASWAQDCNRCTCRNGVATCTKRLCRGPTVDLTPRQTTPTTCIKGTSWRQDCNRCTCENGVPTCTKRLCPDIPATPTNEQENPKPCINGTSWTQDCNRCVCNNGISQCTRRLCPDPPVDPICNDPSHHPDVERCRGFEVLWTFDSAAGKCVEVVYGGCGGTANLFESKATCEERCIRTGHVQGSSRSMLRASLPERCTHEFEQGPCFAMFNRYGYNTKTGRCEQFMYGGCQGNSNNFETPIECQQVCGGGAPVHDPQCDRSQCPWKRWSHYIAKNCVPQYLEGSCCPTRFSCPQADELIPDPTKCYYKGAAYELGDNVPVDDKCSASCRCASGPNMSEIRCANIECPELFRRPSPDCRLLYKPDSCCSYDQECGVPPELESRSTACTWNNKTYRQGDKMYFDDFPCHQCVCTPDFTSPTGPGCSKIDCGMEFRYTSRLADGCVPIFFEQKCCPIGWMCPGDSRLEPSASDNQQQRVSTETAQCHLGELSVPVGAKVPTTDCKIDCRCSTPPELTCVQYRSCEMAEENQPKDCPEVKCSSVCRTVTDSVTGCPTCSCSGKLFTCEKKDCPVGCGKDVDPETGCPSCQCSCPKDPSGRPPCPVDCATRFVTDEVTGCEICECDPTKPVYILGRPLCPAYPQGHPPCPQDCATRTVADEITGCMKCECDPDNPGNPFATPQRSDCPRDHTGSPPCPMDCAIRYVVDEETGCQKCECDPDNPGHPFGPPPRSDCPMDPSGRPPCPMDCAIRIVMEPETGCERCECDPNSPGHPFGPFGPPPPRADCPMDPSGRPPCPMDCAIRYVTDEETGCQKCECDPNNPGHPFGPPPPPPRADCFVGPSGRPPCPMDCARRFITDPVTGCERCECDPNVPVHPFHPLIRPTQQRSDCPTDHTGRAPCPMDCAVIFVTDPESGCERCECDPNNPGNPFNPF